MSPVFTSKDFPDATNVWYFSEISNHIFCWSADNAGVVPTGFYAIYRID